MTSYLGYATITSVMATDHNHETETEKKSEQVLVNLDPPTFQTIKQIALVEDRPLGNVARNLLLRGLSQFNVDGKLRDPETAGAGA